MLNNEVWRKVLTSFVFVFHVHWPCNIVTGNINIFIIIIWYKKLPSENFLSISHQFAHLPWYFAWEPLVVEEGCGIFIFYPSESIIKVMRSVITSSRRLRLVNRLACYKVHWPRLSSPLVINCQPPLSQTWLWALACCHSILNIYFLSIKLYEWPESQQPPGSLDSGPAALRRWWRRNSKQTNSNQWGWNAKHPASTTEINEEHNPDNNS